MTDEFYREYLINLVQDVLQLQSRDLHQAQVVSVDPGFSLAAAGPITEAHLVINFQRGLNSQA